MNADTKRGERIGFVATEDEKRNIEVAAKEAGVSLATFTRNATLREALDVATTIPDLADKLIGTVEPMPVEYHAGMLAEILQGWGMLPVGTQVVLPDGERVLLSQAGRRRVLHQQHRGEVAARRATARTTVRSGSLSIRTPSPRPPDRRGHRAPTTADAIVNAVREATGSALYTRS